MNRVGTIREIIHSTLEWCETSRDHETLREGWFVFCFKADGYIKMFCLDDGRVWHTTLIRFDHMTRELR